MAPVRMRETKLPSRRGIIRTPPQQKGIQRRPLMARSARRSMMATSAQVDVLQKVRKILDKGKINEIQNNPVGIRRLDSKLSVVVRVRPLNPREMTSHAREIVLPVTRQVLLFDPPRPANTTYFKNRPLKDLGNSNAKPKNATYGFDRVYFNQDSNDLIYNEVMKPLIGTLLQGYNCSVFAYGSTGSGKTYTMLGGQESPGLTVLTLRDLYQQLEASKDDYESDVIVSYLEVYNEQISDLLNKSSGPLQIRDAGRGNEAVIVNISEHRPPSVEALLQLLQAGNGNRTQHATDLNAESSRSHAVLMVRISMRDKHRNMETVSKKAKLVMVDLAGSEKGSATGFTGERFREGTNINKSLLSLANCISALSGGKACASFRDSKLTRILKDSLSGNCRTVMVANVSPADTMKEDTLNTLKYASQAKKITLQASQNAMTVQTCLSNFTRVVEEMAEKIEQQQEEQLAAKELIQSLESQLEESNVQKAEKDQIIFELQEKLRTLQQDVQCTWKKLPATSNKLNTSNNFTPVAGEEQMESSLSTTTATECPRTLETNNSENPGDTIMPESGLETKPRPFTEVDDQLTEYTGHVTQISKRLVGNLINLKRMLLDVMLKSYRSSTFTTLLTETGDERYQVALEKTTNKINSMERLTDMYKDNFNNIENEALGYSLSEQFWSENIAEMDQIFHITSRQLRALKMAEVQQAIKYQQAVKGFLWLQNHMSKKMEGQEEMLKDAFLVVNELKNYLRHKELDINEASPRFKKLLDSFLGVPSVRFANVGKPEEGELFEDDILDEAFEDMLTSLEWQAYKTLTGEKAMEKLINDSLNDDEDKAVELSNKEDVLTNPATGDPTNEPLDVEMGGRCVRFDTDISLGVIVGSPKPFLILEGPQGFSLPVISLPEDIKINLSPDDCTDSASAKPILASVAASADPIKFYGLDKPEDEVQIPLVQFEAMDDIKDEQTTEWVGNTTIDIATNNNDPEDLQSQTKTDLITAALPPHHVPNPFSAQNYMPPPLSQVLKSNTNVNADVTFVAASGTKPLESTYVKEYGDTEENLIPPPTTQTKLSTISDLVDKISNNTGAIANPKKEVKSGILSRGRPETINPLVKKGVTSSCSPPKKFRLGGSQGHVPGGSAQKPTPTFQAPRTTTTWKRTPHATLPTSRSVPSIPGIPSKKGSGNFGPPKPNQ